MAQRAVVWFLEKQRLIWVSTRMKLQIITHLLYHCKLSEYIVTFYISTKGISCEGKSWSIWIKFSSFLTYFREISDSKYTLSRKFLEHLIYLSVYLWLWSSWPPLPAIIFRVMMMMGGWSIGDNNLPEKEFEVDSTLSIIKLYDFLQQTVEPTSYLRPCTAVHNWWREALVLCMAEHIKKLSWQLNAVPVAMRRAGLQGTYQLGQCKICGSDSFMPEQPVAHFMTFKKKL